MHFKVYSEKCTSYFEHFRASAASKPLPAEGPVILNVALLYITVQLLKIFLTALQEELPLKGLNNKLNRTQDFFYHCLDYTTMSFKIVHYSSMKDICHM